MKAAAVIALIVAIVLAIAAIGNFIDDSSKRDEAAKKMWPAVGQPEFSDIKSDVDKLEEAQRNDGIMGLAAVVFLIASLAMFSKGKSQPVPTSTPTAPEVTMPAEFKPNPNFNQDVLQAAGKKIQDALSIQCSQHNQTARLENGKIVGCCDDLEKRVAEFLESR
jgi:flagellar basal body-associated protein FliL